MKPRQIDFLSEAEYRSLPSYKADTHLMRTGAICILVMAALILELILLR